MSDYVGSLKLFEFSAWSTLDVVLYSGQKLQLGRTVKGAVKRPRRLHIETKGRRHPSGDFSFHRDALAVLILSQSEEG
jgi:hypothetical protein